MAPRWRDQGEERLRFVAVWIENRDPATVGEVLCNEITQQGRFSHAGLADNVGLPAAIVMRYAKSTPVGVCSDVAMSCVIHGQSTAPKSAPLVEPWNVPLIHLL